MIRAVSIEISKLFQIIPKLIKFILHMIIIMNSYFLLKGEKFYNENVGAE